MAMIEMRAQHKWLFDHAIYLFLGGLGAAAYVIGAIAGFMGTEWETVSKIGVLVSFPAIAIGSMFLMAGLGKPMRSIYVLKNPRTAWISRGVIFITLFSIVAIIHSYLLLIGWRPGSGLQQFLSIFGILFGFFVMIYTGFLLSASRPIAFWSSGILPLLFLFSGLASGLLAILFISILSGVEEPVVHALTYIGIAAVIVEILTLFFHVHVTHRVPEGQKAARILMHESGALLFWLGIVVIGFIATLALLIFSISAGSVLAIIACLAGLAGNLCIREAILKGGVFARLKAGCFEYVVTNP